MNTPRCDALDDIGFLVARPRVVSGMAAARVDAKRLLAAGTIDRPCFARVRAAQGGPAAGAWPLDPTWFDQEGSGTLLDLETTC